MFDEKMRQTDKKIKQKINENRNLPPNIF